MSPDDPRHGTYAGAQAHRRDSEKPCRPCLDASNAYMREHRKTSPTDRQRSLARTRALWRLAAMHHDDYERLYVEEFRAAMNLPRLDARVEARPIERRKAS